MWSGITVLNYNNPEQKYSTSEREISKKHDITKLRPVPTLMLRHRLRLFKSA